MSRLMTKTVLKCPITRAKVSFLNTSTPMFLTAIRKPNICLPDNFYQFKQLDCPVFESPLYVNLPHLYRDRIKRLILRRPPLLPRRRGNPRLLRCRNCDLLIEKLKKCTIHLGGLRSWLKAIAIALSLSLSFL